MAFYTCMSVYHMNTPLPYSFKSINTYYICNMGRSDLPDMYVRAQGRAVPEGKCGHIRQITTLHVVYVM